MPRKGKSSEENGSPGGEASTNSFASQNGDISNEEIAARAYQIYTREGMVEGRDMEHWLQAEKELKAERQNQPGNPAAAPAAVGSSAASPSRSEPRSARQTRSQQSSLAATQ
jgi:hypothetical protein